MHVAGVKVQHWPSEDLCYPEPFPMYTAETYDQIPLWARHTPLPRPRLSSQMLGWSTPSHICTRTETDSFAQRIQGPLHPYRSASRSRVIISCRCHSLTVRNGERHVRCTDRHVALAWLLNGRRYCPGLHIWPVIVPQLPKTFMAAYSYCCWPWSLVTRHLHFRSTPILSPIMSDTGSSWQIIHPKSDLGFNRGQRQRH